MYIFARARAYFTPHLALPFFRPLSPYRLVYVFFCCNFKASIQSVSISSPVQSEEQFAMKVENLSSAAMTSAMQCNKLEAEIRKDRAEVCKLEAQMGGLQQQVDDLQTKTAEEPPIISMYSYVSKIDWDTSTLSVKGNATWPEKGKVRSVQHHNHAESSQPESSVSRIPGRCFYTHSNWKKNGASHLLCARYLFFV